MKKACGSYSQVHIQLVFAVQGRQNSIHSKWEKDLHKYITGIIQKKGHKSIAINGMSDHIHIFFGYKLTDTIPDLVREIKKASTVWIKENRLVIGDFHWQEGYGAFSYSNWDVQKITNYILNQKEHHKNIGFREEYLNLLSEFNIDFDSRFLFDFHE
ncbi:MAG: IS200/IS605 family transposase [Bacteroidetes bacterium]|nr:IS200/IS605 family transposase [Bacteroidota bacterium]